MLETVIPAMEVLHTITEGAGFCTTVTDNKAAFIGKIDRYGIKLIGY